MNGVLEMTKLKLCQLIERVRRRPHLPSQVTSTRMSLCADFRWRFIELGLSVIVLVRCRHAVEEEAMAPLLPRVAVLERERCLFISYAEAMLT
jgi:hypothetical protein